MAQKTPLIGVGLALDLQRRPSQTQGLIQRLGARQHLGFELALGILGQLQRRERMLIPPAGQEVPLTGMEFCLLETMMAGHLSKATSRRVLVEAMGYDYLTFDERRLEVRISRLRKKIRDITGSDDPVKSEWGAGYIFLAPCVQN